jgi:hypothetical protein
MEHFINIRQQHLISPQHASSAQAKTVLITGIPAKYRNEEELMKLYSHLPGGVKNICLNRCLYLLPCSTSATLNESHQCLLLAT